MDGNREVCQQLSLVEDDESDADETSPYLSDTEGVDLDEFVESLPHDVNDWQIYNMERLKLEVIGHGFFGEIYKATNRETDSVMVMKSIKKVGKMKLLCAEIRLMCTLKHPNILSFLGVCLYNSTINLITEYMNVGTLEEVVLDLSEPLPWSLRMKLAHDIAKGMEYLHQKGVIHRDLASKNVLISSTSGSYVAVVADFGLAAKIPSRKKRLMVVGSPYWMAPEVIRRDQYNETVDIFSYGIILCEIIGRVQSSPDDIPRTHDYGLDVDKFREQVEGCPPEFLQLAVCCCQMEPESRPPFEITAKFLNYIRQFAISEHYPAKLKSELSDGNSRKSANIEDWLADKRRVFDISVDGSTPYSTETCADVSVDGSTPYSETYACEEIASVVANGVVEKNDVTCERSSFSDTPCKSRRSNKRNSFFSAIRYKYFKPTVVTEDLVQNTPSKLASFFNRVLHVQKKHKFDRSKKLRAKSTGAIETADRPRLQSFRFLVENVDTIANGTQQMHPVSPGFDETEESPRDLHSSNDLSYNNTRNVKFEESLLQLASPCNAVVYPGALTNPGDSYKWNCPAEERQSLEPPHDMRCSDNSSLQKESCLLMSWPPPTLREATVNLSLGDDINGELQGTVIPRCQSESNVLVKTRKSEKTRSFSTSQQPTKKAPSKQWSFLNLFRRHGKEKGKT